MATRKTEADYERELLARLFTNPDEMSKVGIIISQTDFFNYGKVFKDLKDLIISGKFVASHSPSDLAEKHRFDLSAVLHNWSATPAQVTAKKIKEKSTVRKVVEMAFKAQQNLLSGAEDVKTVLESIQKNILKISLNDYQEKEDIKSIITEYTDYQQEYFDKKMKGEKFIGIPTFFPKIDQAVDGLRKNHIWVIGGYTSTGKSAFALNIVDNVLKQNKRVSVYSLEMSRIDILGRLLGINIGDSPNFIIKNADNNKMYEKEAGYLKELSEKELIVHNKFHTLEQITMSMMKDNFEKKVDLFVVDYLQNISTDQKGVNEYELMTIASREFQKIAEALQVPIIILSQVNNQQAREGGSVMGFKGSGGIAAVADFAIELRRDKEIVPNEKGNVPMKAHIMKNRHGTIGEVDLTFNLRSGKITELLTL